MAIPGHNKIGIEVEGTATWPGSTFDGPEWAAPTIALKTERCLDLVSIGWRMIYVECPPPWAPFTQTWIPIADAVAARIEALVLDLWGDVAPVGVLVQQSKDFHLLWHDFDVHDGELVPRVG